MLKRKHTLRPRIAILAKGVGTLSKCCNSIKHFVAIVNSTVLKSVDACWHQHWNALKISILARRNVTTSTEQSNSLTWCLSKNSSAITLRVLETPSTRAQIRQYKMSLINLDWKFNSVPSLVTHRLPSTTGPGFLLWHTLITKQHHMCKYTCLITACKMMGMTWIWDMNYS